TLSLSLGGRPSRAGVRWCAVRASVVPHSARQRSRSRTEGSVESDCGNAAVIDDVVVLITREGCMTAALRIPDRLAHIVVSAFGDRTQLAGATAESGR